MSKSFSKLLKGYHLFRNKYAAGDESVMINLSQHGQKPKVMVVACCDSRVDPALILQCEPGDLFVVRNVANIVPPYENDDKHHGTSAALEFAICFLKVKHLILLGHSQCGGIQALLHGTDIENDFITNWVSLIGDHLCKRQRVDDFAKNALINSAKNCMTFPWISDRVTKHELDIHVWFFDIKAGEIYTYKEFEKIFLPLTEESIK